MGDTKRQTGGTGIGEFNCNARHKDIQKYTFYPQIYQKCDFFEISRNLKKNSQGVRNSKIPNFPGTSKIFSFHQTPGLSFLKFPGIATPTTCKNVLIYGFPEIYEIKFRFFPEKYRPRFPVFIKIWTPLCLKFPGITVDKITKNARMWVFPKILETKCRLFPEKCRPQFLVFVEIWGRHF